MPACEPTFTIAAFIDAAPLINGSDYHVEQAANAEISEGPGKRNSK